MSAEMGLIAESSQLVRSHITGVAMSMVMVLMAVYGGDMSRVVRKAIRGYNFIVRASVFFFLVVFGYGAMALLVGALIARMLRALDNYWLAPVVGIIFLVLAVVAEERRQF